MPKLSVYMIRFSLIYLGLGMTIGGLILGNKGFPISVSLWQWLPIHIELLMFGWIMQLVMGVAFWIVPRFPTSPKYGRAGLAWTSFILFNIGLWLVIFGQNWLVLGGRIVMFSAVALFAIYLFPRIKPFAE